MHKLIARVAIALWQDESLRASGRKRLVDWDDVSAADQEKWQRLARAAIAAMRAPTKAMIEAGNDHCPGDAPEVWRAMIDAALAEKPVERE